MKKRFGKGRYEDGGPVDYDSDDDPDAQRVFSDDGEGGLYEVGRTPKVAKQSAARKKTSKKDDGSHDRKEQRRAMMSGFGDKKPVRDMISGPMSKGRLPTARDLAGFKRGGSVSSASKRADGIAVKGKTKGRII